MKTKVQVEALAKSLAPQPRLRLARALKALAKDQMHIMHLEGKLAGYSRLRVAGLRVIFHERSEKGERILDCVFAEKRALVYDLFIRLLGESPQK